MLLTEYANLTVNPNNYKYLLSIGYTGLTMNDKMIIPVNHLSVNSGYLVDVKCDTCGNEKKSQYRRYIKSFNTGGYYCCCPKCAVEKNKKTNLERYGAENPYQTQDFKTKSRKTKLEKYGDEYYTNREKCWETCMKNNGVKYPWQSDIAREKMKNTIIEKYGVENISQSEDIKRKKEETCMKNHGVKSPLKNIEIFTKNKKSGLKINNYKNTDLTYQGSYEKEFLDLYYDKINIKNGLSVQYIHNNIDKIYHSDFYIPEIDLVIEVKSTYWYNNNLDINILKEEYTKKHHNYILILDKNYDEFEKLLENLYQSLFPV